MWRRFVSVYQSRDTLAKLGIGFSIEPAQILEHAKSFISSSAASGWANLGTVISGLRSNADLRWANPLEIKNAVEKAFLETFGPKEAAKPKAKVSHVYLET
jgi:glutaminyl-tRNA synthetase